LDPDPDLAVDFRVVFFVETARPPVFDRRDAAADCFGI